METLLKAIELVTLLGLSERHIQRMAKEGKLPSRKAVNEKNRPVLLFPLNSLSPEIQRKYMAQHKLEPLAEAKEAVQESQPLDNFSADEREEIQFWLGILTEWQQYRENYPKDKAQADERYVCLCAKAHPDKTFSIDILYHRDEVFLRPFLLHYGIKNF